jgi:hypothetical protein
MNNTDPNKQYELQQELFNQLKPFIKPEKVLSDEDVVKAIDELSISKQQAKYLKELAEKVLACAISHSPILPIWTGEERFIVNLVSYPLELLVFAPAEYR